MNLIVVDTREKKNKKILEYFDKVHQDYIVSKLDFGDYQIYKDNRVVIDRKDGLLEMSHNLCNTPEHERIKREIQRAKDCGVQKFIFLIGDSKIKCEADVEKWHSPHTIVKGSTLLKIMKTMKKKYGVSFMFCQKKQIGKHIVELLNNFDCGEKTIEN